MCEAILYVILYQVNRSQFSCTSTSAGNLLFIYFSFYFFFFSFFFLTMPATCGRSHDPCAIAVTTPDPYPTEPQGTPLFYFIFYLFLTLGD